MSLSNLEYNGLVSLLEANIKVAKAEGDLLSSLLAKLPPNSPAAVGLSVRLSVTSGILLAYGDILNVLTENENERAEARLDLEVEVPAQDVENLLAVLTGGLGTDTATNEASHNGSE